MLRRITTAVILLCLLFGHCPADTVPGEPEMDNGEYLLDLSTNRYNRIFREIWDGGDNRFRFRLGSNNVRQWFIEEELKFSATLLEDRLRFRFNHARLLRNSSSLLSRDALELEGRVHERLYLSFFATPTFAKGKNSIGVLLQHRAKVNQFFIVAIEFPHFWRNFTERKGVTSDTHLSVFTNRPIRVAVDLRQPITPSLWLRLEGEVIPEFEMGEEETASGWVTPLERASAEGLHGWLEYVWGHDRPVPEQSAYGVIWRYGHAEKEGIPQASATPAIVPPWRGLAHGTGPWPGGEAGAASSERPGVRPGRSDGLSDEIDKDFYTPTEGDTVKAWSEKRGYVEPYVWLVLGKRVTAQASIRFEERTITWHREAGGVIELENRYVVPSIGVRTAVGRTGAVVLEGGLAAQYRWREDRRRDGAPPSGEPEVRCEDHRLCIAFEYHFGPDRIIRLVEAIELDGEDIGQFAIHDHGFLQLLFGF